MDIRIGIQNSAREISFESSATVAEIQSAVAEALSGVNGVLTLTDVKGSVFVVPGNALAYVELGTEETRRVGFVA